MSYLAKADSNKAVYASVTGPDGRVRNLGRIDNKRWAPRAWVYKYITFPRLARKHS